MSGTVNLSQNYFDNRIILELPKMMYLGNVEDLNVCDCKIRDYEFLSQLHNMINLNISKNYYNGFDFLKNLQNLQYLDAS